MSLLLVSDDVKAAYEELKSRGLAFTREPMQASWNPRQTFAIFGESECNTALVSPE